MNEYRFIENPSYAGSYRLGKPIGFHIALQKKPCWFHRTMMKLCFGWEWEDK